MRMKKVKMIASENGYAAGNRQGRSFQQKGRAPRAYARRAAEKRFLYAY